MEEAKTQTKRKRRNAMQPDEEIVELEEKEEEAAPAEIKRDTGRTRAPADYKMMEELIEDPVKEERERRERAVEKWTKESNDQFTRGLAKYGKRFRKIADSLPDHITVADCVEHYYMAKPFRFHFEKWRAREKINVERSLALSLEECQGTSSLGAQTSNSPADPQPTSDGSKEEREGTSAQGPQTSNSPTDPQPISAGCKELESIETERPEEKLEVPVSKPVVIEINDDPGVIVIE